MLRYSFLFLMVFSAMVSSLSGNERTWTSPFFFIQMADCQLGMEDRDRSMDYEIVRLERAAEWINAMKPRFVILCGDLTNAEPWQELYEEQVVAFKSAVSKIDESIPLVCVCGNHDVGNRPTPGTIASYRQNFGDDYFSFWVGGCHCIVLNSSLFFDPFGAPEEADKQLAWLDQELGQEAQHTFVFQHHSWFLNDPDENDGYFNLPHDFRLQMLEKFSQNGVRAIFAGHYHRNAHGWYGPVEMITTSAVGLSLGDDPSGFRIVWVEDDSIRHTFFDIEADSAKSVPSHVQP